MEAQLQPEMQEKMWIRKKKNNSDELRCLSLLFGILIDFGGCCSSQT
jgi:hypothetical protein